MMIFESSIFGIGDITSGLDLPSALRLLEKERIVIVKIFISSYRAWSLKTTTGTKLGNSSLLLSLISTYYKQVEKFLISFKRELKSLPKERLEDLNADDLIEYFRNKYDCPSQQKIEEVAKIIERSSALTSQASKETKSR